MQYHPNLNKCDCHNCQKPTLIKSLTKLTWRYQDKKRRYTGSGRSLVITGYSYLCPKCLKLRTK